ncbi:hypothetical protein AALA52_03630 [Lactococcus ileimucosae]|uniref:Uncharacterized protein n=1 Tax=Lactococcus ileimucosae TaxID=2941329 RepID=A0ABV4D1A5_9LACT
MATRLELAERKLERLKNELVSAKSPMDGAPLGQPIVMNSAGKRIARQLKKYQERQFAKLEEIQEQEKRVEKLQWQERMKAQGKNPSGGLIKSVENLELWKQRVEHLEFVRDYNKKHKLPVNTPYYPDEKNGRDIWFYDAARLKDAKETVERLTALKEQSEQAASKMSALTRELIESGQVNQWKKQPIYYFVSGLRKVALEIDDNGDFQISKRYPARSEEDKQFIASLLETN